MKQNRDAVSLSLLLMLAVVLVAGIVVLWQLPEEDSGFQVLPSDGLLRVYGLQSDTRPEAFLLPPTESDVRSGVRALAGALSRQTFRNAPIHVIGVETVEGELRAFIDLAEPEETGGSTWVGTFFQGSALAQQTERALVETMLQPDYGGDWIESVTFYYQGRPFRPLDHIDLGRVFRRQNLTSAVRRQ